MVQGPAVLHGFDYTFVILHYLPYMYQKCRQGIAYKPSFSELTKALKEISVASKIR